jgi:hypothetical protein
MQDLSRRFIIAETLNGSAFPISVWDADNEQDYVSRVRAAHARSDGADEIETADQAAAFAAECHAIRVDLITEEDFAAMTTDSWDTKIIDRAIQLGWIDPPADE